MIIKRIRIKNFRSYYGDITFELSQGLTLIIGDNGDGKTTFFEALQWLFNTTVDTPSIHHFSEKRKSELEVRIPSGHRNFLLRDMRKMGLNERP